MTWNKCTLENLVHLCYKQFASTMIKANIPHTMVVGLWADYQGRTGQPGWWDGEIVQIGSAVIYRDQSGTIFSAGITSTTDSDSGFEEMEPADGTVESHMGVMGAVCRALKLAFDTWIDNQAAAAETEFLNYLEERT